MKGYILKQNDKKFSVVCNDEYCQVVVSVEGAIEEKTSFPVGSLDDFEEVSEFDVEQETPREGGQQVNLNVLNRDTLIDAQKHPEKYPQLTLRISGYATFFNALTKEQQEDIISRTFTTKF
jgi:autonomous glycyl radical cofactor GrcA